MAVSEGASANVWLEPPPTVNASTDTPLVVSLMLDALGDWNIVSGSQSGGIEDDGTGDFAIYDLAHLPGTHTQLQLYQLGTDISTFKR